MAKKVSRLEVYRLLTGTHKCYPGTQLYCSSIAKILGVSRQRIHKLIKEMENGGYIKCDTPDANQKFYSATSKIYDGEKPIIPDGYELTKLGRRPGLIVQKTRYKITIEREYRDFFKDKKKWMWRNCPCYKYTAKVFDNLDTFEFRKIGKKKLIVIVPGLCFKKHELSIAKNTLFWVVYEALKWFAKKANIRFDWATLNLCQKPHIARASKAAWVKRVASDWSLSIDGKMLDSSSGKADWECLVFDDDVVDAVDALENWDIIGHMHQQIGELQGFHADVDMRQSFMEKKVDEILSSVNDLKIMFKENKHVDKDRIRENLERGMFD